MNGRRHLRLRRRGLRAAVSAGHLFVVCLVALAGLGGVASLGSAFGDAIAAGAESRSVAEHGEVGSGPAGAAHAAAPLAQAGVARASARVAQRVAVIGDVGGHVDELAHGLEWLGADLRTGRLPDGLTVVQVGDLVHKGPDSRGVLELVERFFTANPGRWVQLFGNHEGRYIGGPVFRARAAAQLDLESVERLQDWARRGVMSAAAAVEGPGFPEGVLVTHAGLVRDLWLAMGAPARARDAADWLNRAAHAAPEVVFRPGRHLSGETGMLPPGPVWAEAGKELIASWSGRRAPFGQVHGHTNAYDYFRGRWREPHDIEGTREVDLARRHTVVTVGGKRIVGIDPSHNVDAAPRWEPFVFETPATVVTRPVGADEVRGALPLPDPAAVLSVVRTADAP